MDGRKASPSFCLTGWTAVEHDKAVARSHISPKHLKHIKLIATSWFPATCLQNTSVRYWSALIPVHLFLSCSANT
eukprot:6492042-Amphidinium_carterae.1